MPSTEDKLFLRFARRGDLAALGQVFDHLAPVLLGLARHLTKGRDAEDLVQATFLTAIEKAQSYDPKRGVQPWLLGILSVHARKARDKSRRVPEPRRVAQPTPDDPAAAAESRELNRAFDDALGTLPDKAREVLELRLQGLSSEQIAARLERPGGTVRAQLSRAMAELRRRMPPTYQGAFALAAVDLSAMRDAVLTLGARHVPAVTASATTWIAGAWIMKRNLLAVAALLIVAAAAVLWNSDLFLPPPDSLDGAPAVSTTAASGRTESAHPAAETGNSSATEAQREQLAPGEAVALETDVELRGRCVHAETGAPVAGATVRFEPSSYHERLRALFGDSTWTPPTPVTTGADGVFEFRNANMPAERYQRLRIDGPGVATRWETVSPAQLAKQPTDLGDIELRPGARVFGRLIDERGQPVRLIDFGLVGIYEEAEVDAEGNFDWGGVPIGRHELKVYSFEGTLIRPTHVDVIDPATPVELTVIVRPMPTLAGRVVDTAGAPVPEAVVQISGATEGETEEETTDHEGHFRFISDDQRRRPVALEVLGGPYRVVHGSGTYQMGMRDIRVEVDRGASMQVAVKDRAGVPVEQFCVLCEPDPHPEAARPPQRRHGQPHPGGVATVDGMWPGNYRLRVIPLRRDLADSAWVSVRFPLRDREAVDVTLSRRRPLAVTVRDTEGRAVPRAKVELIAVADGLPLRGSEKVWSFRDRIPTRSAPASAFHEQHDAATTDAAGRAVLHAPPDHPALTVRATGHFAPVLAPVEPGAEAVTLVVARNCQVTGTLGPARLLPVIFRLRFTRLDDGEPTERVARVNEKGAFLVRNMRPGSWEVHIDQNSKRFGDALEKFTLGPGEQRELELDVSQYSTGRLEGRVAFAGPFPNARLTLTSMAEPRVESPRARLRPDGTFAFETVLAGEYRLFMRYEGGDTSWIYLLGNLDKLIIAPDQTTHHDISHATQTLEVRAIDENGAPWANQLIYVWVGSEEPGGAMHGGTWISDDDGTFRVPWAPRGSIIASLDSARSERYEGPAPWSPPTARIEVRLPRRAAAKSKKQ